MSFYTSLILFTNVSCLITSYFQPELSSLCYVKLALIQTQRMIHMFMTRMIQPLALNQTKRVKLMKNMMDNCHTVVCILFTGWGLGHILIYLLISDLEATELVTINETHFILDAIRSHWGPVCWTHDMAELFTCICVIDSNSGLQHGYEGYKTSWVTN